MTQRVVIDTNILVSSLWSPSGTPARIISLIWSGQLIPCYDSNIMDEYFAVLHRPHFKFSNAEVSTLLRFFRNAGLSVVVQPSTINLLDESDRKFYDVAKACDALLITGNTRHYPDDPAIVTAAELLKSHVGQG